MTHVAVLLLGFGLAANAWAANQDSRRLQAAGQVIDEIMQTPDKGIPSNLFQKAHCVIVIPSMKKAGFIFSGKYGKGFAVCRKSGGGFGLQAGGSATDVVLLVMSKKGADGLLASKFTLGGEASVAGGPGRSRCYCANGCQHAG
jgi:lipid-binding SYLF domain-containing protein